MGTPNDGCADGAAGVARPLGLGAARLPAGVHGAAGIHGAVRRRAVVPGRQVVAADRADDRHGRQYDDQRADVFLFHGAPTPAGAAGVTVTPPGQSPSRANTQCRRTLGPRPPPGRRRPGTCRRGRSASRRFLGLRHATKRSPAPAGPKARLPVVVDVSASVTGLTGRSARNRRPPRPAPARSCGPSSPRPRPPSPGRSSRPRPCRRTAVRRAPCSAASSTRSSPPMVNVDSRPSSTIVTSAPAGRRVGPRRAGSGAASTWNSSVWTAAPARPARSAPPWRPAPCRTGRRGTTRRPASPGRRCRAAGPAGRRRSGRTAAPTARLPGQHVHQVQPGRVAVLQVGQLLGEHHRAGRAVAVHQGEPCWPARSPARWRPATSTGVMPDPATTAP